MTIKPAEIRKALVALVGIVVFVVHYHWHINLGPISADLVTLLNAAATAILVWWVPNKPKPQAR